MRITFQDRKEGIIKLIPDSIDDLWHLSQIFEPDDLVTARTLRKTSVKRGNEIETGEKRPVTLTIKVEKVDFHPYTYKLRVTGKIKEGPDDVQLASYHTFDVDPGIPIKIQKKWKPYQLERLKKARIKKPLLLLVMIDREQTDFLSMKESGLEFKGTIHYRKVKGKEDEREHYHSSILEKLEAEEEYQHIIVAGPGFERDNLAKYIRENSPDIATKVKTEYASYTGKAGAQEVIKNSLNNILKQTRIAEETFLVEEILKRMNKGKLAVYGKKDTLEAIQMGAVETLLIAQEKIKEFEDIMKEAEKVSSRIVIISAEHESAEKLLGLGGIGALLRFELRK